MGNVRLPRACSRRSHRDPSSSRWPRIQVLWPDTDTWYNAEVLKVNVKARTATLYYTDTLEKEDINLSEAMLNMEVASAQGAAVGTNVRHIEQAQGLQRRRQRRRTLPPPPSPPRPLPPSNPPNPPLPLLTPRACVVRVTRAPCAPRNEKLPKRTGATRTSSRRLWRRRCTTRSRMAKSTPSRGGHWPVQPNHEKNPGLRRRCALGIFVYEMLLGPPRSWPDRHRGHASGSSRSERTRSSATLRRWTTGTRRDQGSSSSTWSAPRRGRRDRRRLLRAEEAPSRWRRRLRDETNLSPDPTDASNCHVPTPRRSARPLRTRRRRGGPTLARSTTAPPAKPPRARRGRRRGRGRRRRRGEFREFRGVRRGPGGIRRRRGGGGGGGGGSEAPRG